MGGGGAIRMKFILYDYFMITLFKLQIWHLYSLKDKYL